MSDESLLPLSGAPVGERLTAVEVIVRTVSQQISNLSAQISPMVTSHSGLLGRLERAESDLTRAHDKHRETETWKAQIENRLGKHDQELQSHVQAANSTMAEFRRELVSQSRVNEAQAEVNQSFSDHIKEWSLWKNRLFGAMLVVQALVGLIVIFKDQIVRAVFGG